MNSTKTVYLGAELKQHLADAAKKVNQNESFFAREAIATHCREVLGAKVVGEIELKTNASKRRAPAKKAAPKTPAPKTPAVRKTAIKPASAKQLASDFDPFADAVEAEISPVEVAEKKDKKKKKKKGKKKS